jgi:hypothetical protein
MQEIKIRPRQGGKTAEVKAGNRVHRTAQQTMLVERAGRVHRVILPMSPERRKAAYIAQNTQRAGIVAGGGQGLPFTAAQLHRMRKKDPASRPEREIAQDFRNRTGDQRKPTGRVGRKRFGPAMSMDGLNKLLFGARSSQKNMDLGQHQAASAAGRLSARTGHGRKRIRRGSRRNG